MLPQNVVDQVLEAPAGTTVADARGARDPVEARTRAGRLARRIERILPAAVIVLGALALRAVFVPIETGDFRDYLMPWWNELREHGHFAALKTGFSNYTPAYLYVLALVSYLPVSPLWGVKATSMAFDLVLALVFARMVEGRVKTRLGRLVALALPLYAPSVILNGSAWGQCDVIHTLFVLLSLRAALKDRWRSAALFLGVGLAVKLQTIFFMPALILMMVRARVRPRVWATLLLAPAVFLASLVPAWIAGRPAVELLKIYVDQAQFYHEVTIWAPNLFQWFPGAPNEPMRQAGLILTAMLLAAAFFVVREAPASEPSQPVEAQTYERLLVAVGISLVCPFFLPGMHERYFYTADVLALLLPFWTPRRWWVPAAVGSASTFSCCHFLFGQNPFDMKLMAAFVAAALVAVARDWFKVLRLR